MTTETPAQRRTRLIEQYVRDFRYKGELLDDAIALATELAEAVIAATPQESEPPTVTIVARYPSAIEMRLIELCDAIINETVPLAPENTPPYYDRLAAIKRDLGLD